MYNQKTKLHAILKEKINPDCLIKPSSPLPPCLHTSVSGSLRINSEWTWTDLTHSISQTFPLDDSHICELAPNKAKRKNAGYSTGIWKRWDCPSVPFQNPSSTASAQLLITNTHSCPCQLSSVWQLQVKLASVLVMQELLSLIYPSN